MVPAFNEEKSIARTLRDIGQATFDIDVIVINDGSKDRTSAAARAAGGALVADLPVNLGIGGALQTGLLYAKRSGYDFAFQFDGDGQHRGDEIVTVLKPLIEGKADAVIGSRFLSRLPGFKSTAARRIGIRILQLANFLAAGVNITDCTSGFRAYNRDAIDFLAEHYPSDFPEPETVVLLAKNRFRIVEVFTQMRERAQGISSISGLRSFYYMVKVLLAIAMTALRPRVRWKK